MKMTLMSPAPKQQRSNVMRLPFDEKTALVSSRGVSVSTIKDPPFASTIATSSSAMKTMHEPSGDRDDNRTDAPDRPAAPPSSDSCLR
jgi:hypothetical protein